MLEDPVNFSGWVGESYDLTDLTEIRFGFFFPDNLESPKSRAMLNGATLAILLANQAGGYHGIPYRLIHRWANEPWNSGSKEIIKLVYQDQVWAIFGSVDGESSHVAQQIVTKTWLPLLSPISSDPTLTHIRIPWIFRLPPDDQVQAEILFKQGILPLSIQRIGLITSTDHDGRVASFELREALKNGELNPVFHFQISPQNVNYQEIALHTASYEPEGIVLRLPIRQVLEILPHLQENNLSCPLFLPWIPGLQEKKLKRLYRGKIVTIQPFSISEENSAYTTFHELYLQQYGLLPDPSAAYTFDAVNIVIQALLSSGLNRANLRDAIARLNTYQGVTGSVIWDNGGGNLALPVVSIVR